MSVTWSIGSVESRTADGFVCTAHYSAVLNEDRIYGSVAFERVEDVSEVNSYVAYDQLTEELIIGWVKDVLGEEEVEVIEADLARRDAERVAPVMQSGLPW